MGYLVDGKIDTDRLLDAVAGHEFGGTVLFCGTVRAGPDDGPVSAIEYSAYAEMADAEFSRIESEVTERWRGVSVAVKHRLGKVPVGEASIAIAVGAAHRAEAFEACRFVIDEAKVRVPIWKREFLEGGDARWRSNEQEATDG